METPHIRPKQRPSEEMRILADESREKRRLLAIKKAADKEKRETYAELVSRLRREIDQMRLSWPPVLTEKERLAHQKRYAEIVRSALKNSNLGGYKVASHNPGS